MSAAQPGADARAAWAAVLAATVIITLQLAGKATRDALFLSTFGVAALPPVVIIAAILSGFLAVVLARRMAQSRPGRLVPRLFAFSALLLAGEWMLAGPARREAAVLVYLHLTAIGAILVSGFWAMVNERFDPRTARQAIARITAGGSIGGLLGGLLPERVGSTLPLTTMLPILVLLQLLAAGLVSGVEQGAPPQSPIDDPDAEPVPSAGAVLRRSSYLTGLALLVALTSSAEGVLDYVFKARASAAALSGEQLLRFFAGFYTVTALIGILIQVTALRPLLGRLGIARSASLLPAGVSAGAVGAFLVPGLIPIMLVRGLEVVLRSSVFRAGYELLFTPVAPVEKRATKLLLDVGAARVGDVIGATLIMGALALAAGGTVRILLGLTFVLSVTALVIASRLHRGYVAALEGSIHRRAGLLPDAAEDNAAAWLQTVGGFELSGIRSRLAIYSSSPSMSVPAQPVPANPLETETSLVRAMRGGKSDAVRQALTEHPPRVEEIELLIELLAWDAVAPAAIRALRELASDNSRTLVRHLLDPNEDFAIRRRLINVLASCRSLEVFDGLFQALGDRRFEVRYRAGRALSGMAEEIEGLTIDRERVLAVVLREIRVERGVWESRQLIDAADEETSPMAAEVLRDRVNRSVEHLFTLLSLVFPRETLRLAFHALHTDDPYLRGTALEYLETVLPESVWARLSTLLEPGEVPTSRPRASAEVLEQLLASRESITIALAEARRGMKP